MRRDDWTKILGWPGYTVYQQEIDEKAKTLKLWVRRKRGNRRLICSACGRRVAEPADTTEREVRDLPWGEFRTTVVIELYWVRCPACGLKIEKVDQLPSWGIRGNMNAIPGGFRTVFRDDLEQGSGMKVNGGSAMKPNSFRPIPESCSASSE